MADYYNFEQVIQICGVPEVTLSELQRNGFLEPTVKRGRSFLSSQQVYRLRVAIRHAHKDKIDLQEALKRVEARWLAQTTAFDGSEHHRRGHTLTA